MSGIGAAQNTGAVRSLTGITTFKSGTLTIQGGDITNAGTISAATVNAADATFDQATIGILNLSSLSLASATIGTLTASTVNIVSLSASAVDTVTLSADIANIGTLVVSQYNPVRLQTQNFVTNTEAMNFGNATLINARTIHARLVRGDDLIGENIYGAIVPTTFVPASGSVADPYPRGSIVITQTDPPRLLVKGTTTWYALSTAPWAPW